MATGEKKDKTDEEEVISDVLTGLAIAGGAAIVGYGLYKLITAFGEEPKTPNRLQEYKFECGTLRNPSRAMVLEGAARRPNSQNLHENLHDYYVNYVYIPFREMKAAKQVADEVKKHYKDFVMEHAPEVEFWDTGSTTEGLKVIRPDEFDVMVVADAKHNFHAKGFRYEIIKPGNLVDVAGFYKVRRGSFMAEFEGLCQATRWTDPVTKCMDYDYLSPEEVRRSFKSMMDHAFRGYTKYDVRRKEQGPSVMLEVAYFDQGQRKRLSIDFVPAYKFDDKVLVAKPHPMSGFSKEHASLWRVSYSREERDEVLRNAGPEDCERKCLKILKAVKEYRHAELGMLSSYVLKTAWLHMVSKDNTFWKEEAISSQFVSLIKHLNMYLERGQLPHYFDRKVNVLSGFSESERRHAIGFLSNVISKGNFGILLRVPSI